MSYCPTCRKEVGAIHICEELPQQPRYGTVNASRQDHINRLRTRCRNAKAAEPALKAVIMGILDLLADDGG